MNDPEAWQAGDVLPFDPLTIQQQGKIVVMPQAVLVADGLSEPEVQVDQIIFLGLGNADLVGLAKLTHELLDGFLNCARAFMIHGGFWLLYGNPRFRSLKEKHGNPR